MRIFSTDEKIKKEEKAFFMILTACLIIGIILVMLSVNLNIGSLAGTFGAILIATFCLFIPSIAYIVRRNSKDE